MRLHVKGNERLVRDSDNFAILNTDKNVLSKHEQKMSQLEKERRREAEINRINDDISEIKSMLAQLLKSK